MRKSIGNTLLPEFMGPDEGLELIHKAGYDGVEFWLEKEGFLNQRTSDAQALALLAKARDHGLDVSDIATTLHWETPFSSPDARVRQRAAEIVRRQIEVAALMQAGEVLVVAGLVTPGISYLDCYQRTLDTLGPLGAVARKAGVVIGLENCNAEQKFLMGPMEFAAFVDRLGEGFGAHLDVDNIHDTGYAEQWVHILGHRIVRTHMKDTLRGRGHGGGSVYTNIFLGDNNWPAILRGLREVGYDGWLIAEMEQRYRYCRDQQFYDTSAALSRLIALAG